MRLGEITKRLGESNEINIAPLIDIVFILLIFFMVTTTFTRDEEMELQRPEATSGQPADAQALRLGIDVAGRITLEGQPLNRWMVQTHVRRELATRSGAAVLVVADHRVESGLLVEVVDQCRLAGARDVAVAVQGDGA